MSTNNSELSLVNIHIEDEMQRSYLDYAMSVIVSRALPDARDGLKPVQRRVIFAMHEMNNYPNKPYKKSARVVGDVIGKYHPHGNDPIYGSLVRMAQDFSLRQPLIDGQGNFGSMDGDSPAQMRYTEVRLDKISIEMLDDIEKNTVNYQDNYDGSEIEPQVLPTKFPNLLVNGAAGIAVGMATNIPTHNFAEVARACCAYIENPEITIGELTDIVPGPDFPTGGIITNAAKAKVALSTGRGSISIRAKTHFEVIGGKDAIIATEIPYQVNKAEMLRKIEGLIKTKSIEGISEIRDESNKLGVRVVIEIKRGFDKDVILNQLFKNTQLQGSFAVNMLALDKGQPKLLNLKSVIEIFVRFREEVVQRRITFLLNKARVRAHNLIGLYIAVANIDEVIKLIKSSPDPTAARNNLMERSWHVSDIAPLLELVNDTRNKIVDGNCNFTEEQARAILDMKLQKLTALEKNKIDEELKGLSIEIEEYIKILSSRHEILSIIKNELLELEGKFNSPRLTEIQQIDDDVDLEDLIQQEDMVVTMTYQGYIKRVPLATYRAQRRGGKGRSAMATHDDDFTSLILATNTHEHLLFFSSMGIVYRTKVYRLPLGSPNTKGRAMVNLLPLAENEKITKIITMSDEAMESSEYSIIFCTANGNVRRSAITDFARIQSNGKIAIRLDDEDSLVGVSLCGPQDHIFMSTAMGKAIRFPIEKLRVIKSRTSDGVIGIKLSDGDKVVSLSILSGAEFSPEQRDAFLKIPFEQHRLIKESGAVTADIMTMIKENGHAELLDQEKIEQLAATEDVLLCMTEKGFGKRSSSHEYRVTNRGGSGVVNINVTSKNGNVVENIVAEPEDEIILMTDGGTLLRTSVSSIRMTGRNTMGVKVIDTREGESVISVTRVSESDEEEEVESEEIAATDNSQE